MNLTAACVINARLASCPGGALISPGTLPVYISRFTLIPLDAVSCDGWAMRNVLYAQLNPAKTMRQMLKDRHIYRGLILGALLIAWCL